VHLVAFTIEIYYDALSYKRHILLQIMIFLVSVSICMQIWTEFFYFKKKVLLEIFVPPSVLVKFYTFLSFSERSTYLSSNSKQRRT